MKIKREREITIIEYSTERQIDFEYAIIENGVKLFGLNNGKMPIEFVTKALFKPIPKEVFVEQKLTEVAEQ